MANTKYHLRSAVLSAAGFGVGFTVGAFLSSALYRSPLVEPILDSLAAGRLLTGVILVLLIAGLGGALGGALGGPALAYAYRQFALWPKYTWRSAVSFGLSFALIVAPLTLILALLSFYDLSDVSPLALMFPLGLLGLIFGLVSGATLGLLSAAIPAWRVALVGAASFGLGGAALGRGVFAYYLSLQNLESGNWTLFTGLFLFGAIGGGSLGLLYSWLAHRRPAPSLPRRFADWFNRQRGVSRVLAVMGIVVVLLALRALYLISPFTASEAALSGALALETLDTRWTEPAALTDRAAQPVIAAARAGSFAVAWMENGDVFYLTGEGQTGPLTISDSGTASGQPQLVVAAAGAAHLLWMETAGEENQPHIFYSRCQPGDCTPPAPVSSRTGPPCLAAPEAHNSQPALDVDSAGTVLAVWRNGSQALLFDSWQAGTAPAGSALGCVSLPLLETGLTAEITSPRLSAGESGVFGLVFGRQTSAGDGPLYLSSYRNGDWSAPEQVGVGSEPEIYVDDDQPHLSWCDGSGQVIYRQPDGSTKTVAGAGCQGRPALAVDSAGSLRLVWFSHQVQNGAGITSPIPVLMQRVRRGGVWQTSSIVAQPGGAAQPSLAADQAGDLHLAYAAAPDSTPAPLFYSRHRAYNCAQPPASAVTRQVLAAARQSSYRPDGQVPYCQNRFDRFMYAPNPVATYTDIPPTPNGPFDKFAELATTARYEVLFATMWYDGFTEADNPGRVLGRGLTELYEKVKANPDQYPRGVRVRLLLGNPPSFAFFPSFKNQVWALLNDLQGAGLPALGDESIGWQVEVANYSGSWPHSHTKMMIVDGQTVQSVGYNMQHSHLPIDHPSGKGKGRVDLGVQITGPVAQSAVRAFDELWQASTVVDCGPVDPGATLARIFNCAAKPGRPGHAPEVLQYYVPDEAPDNAVRVFRTHTFLEGDRLYTEALAAAQDSIDVIHINFSLEFVCALNILVEACTYANRVEYMDALMQAAENGARLRILTSDVAWVGIENRIALRAFEDELAARGLINRVEVRFFEQDMHIKAALVDNEFLVLGNQNFHYSAWGGGGSLAEFNVGVEAPAAVEQFRRYFDYYWARASQRE